MANEVRQPFRGSFPILTAISGYGYISIEKFVDAARDVNAGIAAPGDFDKQGLPTIRNTIVTTAIIHAGRISLDEKRPVFIKSVGDSWEFE